MQISAVKLLLPMPAACSTPVTVTRGFHDVMSDKKLARCNAEYIIPITNTITITTANLLLSLPQLLL